MVEPQEDSILSEVMKFHQKAGAKSLEKTQSLPGEMVKQAQRRVDGFNSLKGEIDEDMAKAHESLDRVRGKIQANTLSEHNPHGLLSGNQNDYLKCLEMKHRDFEQLLKKDEARWAENLQTKREEANHAQQ